ncbi:MAG TPA: putative glycoside hydrolase [Acetivibrio sp.]|uniref:putative glycoside hydrolase n=1 Tax=Acetivibrio sp. TaxID=1872092 RepID=UPI002B61FBEC|nr:putative glycoside hydrolase [Acetivibrio sp.]HOM03050.1 putative glycoside hydrolase [Acetivibrio sp.]
MSAKNAQLAFRLRNFLVVLFVLVFVFSFTACKGTDVEVNNPVPTAEGTDNGQANNEGNTDSDVPNPSEPNEEASPEPNNSGEDAQPAKKDIKVKALYLTGWTVGSDDRVQHYIDLANSTEINAYVVDIKDDDGYVGYESNIPAVREIGGWKSKYNADKVLKAFHDNNIHVIGRLVCFKDPVLSSKKPELAVKSVNGGSWRDNHNLTWLDPYNKDSWPYLIEIAKEAVEKGFDEIQFDYIRFPNDGSKKSMAFNTGGKEKYEVINEFLAYAREQLPGVVLSADVFGIILESPADTEDIGQYLETIVKDVDYISPMVYPSHYAVGQKVNGVQFMKPDLDPYGVVYQSLAKCKDRLAQVEGKKADVRAYVQDFTASWLGKGYYQTYGPEQVRQQIQAIYDAGYEEWIFWDANNTYSEEAFLKE